RPRHTFRAPAATTVWSSRRYNACETSQRFSVLYRGPKSAGWSVVGVRATRRCPLPARVRRIRGMSSTSEGVRTAMAEAQAGAVPAAAVAAAAPSPVPDRFFRDMVASMRNGVIAVTRDGHVAVLNTIACQVLNVPPRVANLGSHYTEVLQ